MADNKHSMRDIAIMLARRSNISETEAETFVKAFIDVVLDGLTRDMIVKIKNLGTFKLINVDSRESINVNTGERIVIEGHSKVSFTPDPVLRDEINKPFADFQTVIMADDLDISVEEEEEDDEETIVVQDEEEQTPEELPVAEEPAAVEEPMPEAPVAEPMPVVTVAPTQQTEVVEKQEEVKKKTSSVWAHIAYFIIVLGLMAASYMAGYYHWPNISISITINTPQKEVKAKPQPKKVAPKVEKPKVETPKPQPKPEEQYEQMEGARYLIVGEKGTHVLQEGGSLRQLAVKYYGNKDFTPYIIHFNHITNPDIVPVGMKIRLPELKDTAETAPQQ